ncbi:dTDP-4-dehydrorhamnose reductase [Maribacter arcticus]|uniref:dTDP-4-dehydrorhamnose reductase n=1 Tax=Maribacter arcticus TaxID=561365 RepID=A0A1T5BU36_9FLAO|nr:dTDP-4-dehydrorhamnose reductase [Maribacter arcticus]SKB50842.1 dTDP-4-dehydrorhamnose reductase [Maribacter arcticus]
MLSILVTGSNGQLGMSIQEIKGQFTENIVFHFTDANELDISNEKAVRNFFKNKNYDYCINCAAYTAVDNAEDNKDLAYAINADGSKYLAKVCDEYSCIFIHVSTDFVFDGTKEEPYTTLDQPRPLNIYGASKLEGERLIQKVAKKYFIIRTSWVYSEFGNNFVKTMIKLGKEKDRLDVVSDQIGSPTYARDLAHFLLKIILDKNNKYGIYHFSNEGVLSWYDFAQAIIKLSNSDTKVFPVTSSDYITKASRPKYSVMNKEKTIKTFGIKLEPWQTSLKTCVQNLN